ncbi:hypothetical protein [Treponema sp.]|uniref:hypothetical protein n=1 Tax=Treponema sp. TaxID=166 RepID=UPI00388FF77D
MDRHTCKRNKALTCSFFAILAFIFSLVSCDNFNKPIREYFDYYTNTAGVMDFSVPESIGKYAGMNVIESNGDKEVYLYLRNPKKYLLNFEFEPDQEDCYRCEFSPEQDSGDRSMAKITLRSDILQNAETSGGFKNISGNITVRTNDETSRKFASFPFSLMVNSAPPRIQGAMYQRNKSGGEDGTEYIICFNIPSMKGTVHEKDTKDLYIGSEHYRIDSSTDILTITDAEGNPTTKLSTNRPSELKDIDGGDPVFDLSSEYVQYYYHTGIRPEDSDEERKCKISLVDDYNFKKEVIVSSQMAKLEKPYINVNETKTVRETDGKYDLVISHSGIAKYKTPGGQEATKNCSSPIIEYEIYKVGGTPNPFKSGSARAPVKIPLDKGKYYVKAYAQAEGFADGDKMDGDGTTDTTFFTVKPYATYYVKAGGSTGNGSKNSPYNSIQYCVNEIKADAVEYGYVANGYTIELLSDIKAIETDEFDADSPSLIVFERPFSEPNVYFKFILNGNGHKIDADGKGRVIRMDYAPDVTLNNTIITGGNVNLDGGGILFGGHSAKFTMNGGSITGNNALRGGAVSHFQNYQIYFNGVTITGNHATQAGGGIYLKKNIEIPELTLLGNCNITGNTQKENNAPSNVYLGDEVYITIVSESDGATNYTPFSGRVGITTENDPQIGNEIQLTQNFDQYKASGLSPYAAFIPDSSSQGCIVYDEDTGEVYLSESSSSFTTYAGEKITVSCTGSASANGGKITVAVNNEAGDSITSQCTFSAHMITYMSHPLGNNDNYFFIPNGNQITLKNTITEEGDGYALYVQITYNGFTYDATLPFAVN